MIIYITGASGVGKTTIIKDLPIKGYDLDDIYEANWKKHKKFETVGKGVKKDIAELVKKHTHVVFVGLQGSTQVPFTPDIVYILVRKDYEQFYRDKLVRDLNLLCKYKSDFEDVFKNKPFDEFVNYFPYNDVVNMKSFDEFKKYLERMNKHLHKDFPNAEMLTATEIIKKIDKII
jgi:hypothetical protein